MAPDETATKLYAVQAFCGYPPYVNMFADLENMRPLHRAREIAQLEDRQRFLIIELEEFGELKPEFARHVRAELDRLTDRLAELKEVVRVAAVPNQKEDTFSMLTNMPVAGAVICEARAVFAGHDCPALQVVRLAVVQDDVIRHDLWGARDVPSFHRNAPAAVTEARSQ